MLLAAVLSALAGQAPPDRPDTLTALERRAAADRVRARFLREEETSILAGLRAIEQRLAQGRQEVSRLSARVEELDGRLEVLSEAGRVASATLDRLRERAGARAAAMLRMRRTSVARLAAALDDPVAARQLRDRFRRALGHDRSMLSAARGADEAARAAARGLVEERSARVEALAELEQRIAEESLLEEERRALSAAVREERRMAERLAAELAEAARHLEQELLVIRGRAPVPDAAPGGIRAQRGRLPWPTAGRLEVGFGKRVDPGSDVVLLSKGIEIAAPRANPVRAVHDGVVVHAARFDGFGRLVIVAHDDRFFTLYAHLERFAVREGDQLSRLQVLGFVGDSDAPRGPRLYFELRDGATPLDPLRWLVDEAKERPTGSP